MRPSLILYVGFGVAVAVILANIVSIDLGFVVRCL